MRTRVAAVLTVLTLFAGSAAATAAPPVDQVPPPPVVPGGELDYVALGDSYTAGPLVPIPTPGPLGCVRSSSNYPAFLAAYLQVRTFTDVSCSAARTEHLFVSQPGILPQGLPENQNAPQLLAVTEDTDLVTLGIGGNDFGLFGELIETCADLAAEDPQADAPCRDHFTTDGVDTKLRDAAAIQANVEEALVAIGERAPEATVVVVGYLHILPEEGTCAAVPFAPGDYAWGTEVQKALNTSLQRAAQAHGAVYVDMYAASVGRDACAAQPWVNGAKIRPDAFSYHPFRSGMKGIADTVFAQLTGQPPGFFALPLLQLVKRLPDLVDVDALLTYVASGGSVPPQVLEDAQAQQPGGEAAAAPPSVLADVMSVLAGLETAPPTAPAG
ncbi:MAG: SGNH/GDSL hydrolase family protein [Aeromicrobium sp.]|uniref:SGNH/GDSL hydrolase family protein n=1 Tax=Aeromicrobium sp. TaxID=1871063 RepID=UPI0026130F53|nr:SGNH/GDSL hydrolase family protein [Aeromicrobium sp.]MDF1706314.1 SGNH/GDSL hydrolase family protein [Aeromicrobium sp.]